MKPHILFPAIAVLTLIAIWGTTLNLIKIERTAAEQTRERLIRLFVRRGCSEPDEAKKMLAWKHGGGFCVDASVRIEGWDRAGLERLHPTPAVSPACPISLRRAPPDRPPPTRPAILYLITVHTKDGPDAAANAYRWQTVPHPVPTL